MVLPGCWNCFSYSGLRHARYLLSSTGLPLDISCRCARRMNLFNILLFMKPNYYFFFLFTPPEIGSLRRSGGCNTLCLVTVTKDGRYQLRK